MLADSLSNLMEKGAKGNFTNKNEYDLLVIPAKDCE